MTNSILKIDKSRLDKLLATATDRARELGRPVLAALTRRIPSTDGLAALENISRAVRENAQLASEVHAGRMFWACPGDGFALTGIGAVATFAPEGQDRFARVESSWSALLDGEISDNPDGASGPGPLLMGGFAFEPDTRQSGAWAGFGSAHMIVPRLLIATVGDKCWVTLSMMVDESGRRDVDAEFLDKLLRAATDTGDRSDSTVTADSPDELFFSESRSAADWRSLVSRAVREISSGEMQKVVLARDVHVTAPDEIDAFAALRHLRDEHRNSFVFGYWRGDRAFVGASPERLARLDGREVRASSLAGTEKRGASPEEDAALSQLLLSSAKDLAEHAAVRDSLFDALSEISDEVEAAETPSLLTLPHLHHLHTPVRARLREGLSLLDVVARLHPTPAVGGTPREAALRFIRENEKLDRGWYAAPIGWVGRQGGEFAVALRSAVIDGGDATLFAGCGIVADSDPDLEYRESVLKLQPMQAAIAAAVAEKQSDLTEIDAITEVSR